MSRTTAPTATATATPTPTTTTATATATATRAVLGTVLLVPLLAFLTHQALFAGLDRPDNDHGTGSMFDLIAPRYDRINRVLALGMDLSWRQEMVQEIQASSVVVMRLQEQGNNDDDDDDDSNNQNEPPRILDVSTGTADVALLLAKAIPTARILGIDPSPGMLEIGRRKVKQQSMEQNVELREMDARSLESLPQAAFDAATMAFGIRNVPERNVALCQIHERLRNKARFCILEFSEPDDSFGPWGRGARLFIRHVIPLLGGILSGAPREYWHLQNSIQNFPSPSDFSNEINELPCQSGTYVVEQVRQLCFGSVQIYILSVQRAEQPQRTTKEQDER